MNVVNQGGKGREGVEWEATLNQGDSPLFPDSVMYFVSVIIIIVVFITSVVIAVAVLLPLLLLLLLSSLLLWLLFLLLVSLLQCINYIFYLMIGVYMYV